ncbi:MAG: hypothetical protein WBO23_09080 [Burkholderiales bacterium]
MNRQQVEAALAEAAANLARAEADLARAVADHARAESNPVEGDAPLDRARTACRGARASLVQLNREVPLPAPNERTGKPIRRAAVPPAAPTRRPITIEKRTRAFPGLHALERAVPGWRRIGRQSLMLLALVLAYLQFYFFDVQLEVTRLPSIALSLLLSG